MGERRKDDSKARVQRLFAERRAAGLVQVRVWIPDTPGARLAVKNHARDLRVARAAGVGKARMTDTGREGDGSG